MSSVDDVQDISPLVQYIASGGQTVFAYPFPIFAGNNLVVYDNDTLQTLTTHYTVSGAGADTGGNVTFLTGRTAGHIITIYRNVPMERLTDFSQNGPRRSADMNDELDRLTMYVQQLKRDVGRAVRMSLRNPQASSALELEPINNWKSRYLFINSSGALEPAAAIALTTLTQALIGGLLTPQTGAEAAAGVTPINLAYPPGYRPRYNTLADCIAICATHPAYLFTDETITAAITIPDGGKIYGINRPKITNSTAGSHIFDATSKSNIVVDGVRFKGANTTTAPLAGFGGFSAANTGLVTLTTCTNSRITNCEADTFYNGLTLQNCDYSFVLFNRVVTWFFAGVVFSSSRNSACDYNGISDCTATVTVAYGVIATGDDVGGKPQRDCSISYNEIANVPSWDGIMSHDCDGLTIIGNNIRNVRTGIDIGHLVATNVVKRVKVLGNTVVSTTTDTWAGAAAAIAGIVVAGFNNANRVLGATIVGNTVSGFFGIAASVAGGNSSNLGVVHADDVTLGSNAVEGVGSAVASAGVYISGTVNRLAVTGNTLSGTMASGGVRFIGATVDVVSVTGNVIKQATAADAALSATGSTISGFQQAGNVSNSTTPFSVSTSTITYIGPSTYRVIVNQAVASLAAGASRQDAFAITGIAAGDAITVTLPNAWPAGLNCSPPIIGGGQIFLQLHNPTGGALAMAANNFVFDVTLYR